MQQLFQAYRADMRAPTIFSHSQAEDLRLAAAGFIMFGSGYDTKGDEVRLWKPCVKPAIDMVA